MISELIKFENIGTPNYLIELSKLIHKGSYNRSNINDFFTNKIIDDKTIFDGGIFVLEHIGFIDFSEKNLIYISNKYQHFLKNDKLLKNKIVSMFIDKWRADDSFNEVFNKQTLFHDINRSIVVDNSAFKFKYSKLKQFLIDFGVFIDSYIDNCFLITNQYKKYFDKNVVKKVQLSLDELEKIQNLKNQHGEEAEIFVLKLEKQKFQSYEPVEYIEQISRIDVFAGYDIASLMNKNSRVIDKFIEVKSYSEKSAYFHWSKNEIRVAQQEQDNYFLYLVNRDDMNNKDYQPIMIRNPFKAILNNKDWQKDCQSWRFKISLYS